MLEAAYFVSQIAAAVAIFISLMFVAIEVRRNTAETRRVAMEEATSHRTDFVRMMATDPALTKLLGAGLSGKRLDAAQWLQFSMFIYAIFVEYELNERKRRRGDLDAELWDAWLEGYRWWLQFPGVRKWWSTKPAGFTAAFRALVDGEIAASVADEAMLAQIAKIATD
jgi:hypothetical protein